MKKIIAAVAALSMISTPALADRRGGHRDDHRGGGCGWLCGAIIGGVVVGAIASSSRNRAPAYQDSYEYNPPERQYQYVCQNEYVRDYNGNYILDRYGRAIYTQRCWYQ